MAEGADLSKINYGFRTTVEDMALAAHAEAALDAASRADAANQRGAVLCQLSRCDDGRLVLSGSFIEHEYGVRIQKILDERKAAYQEKRK
jgi:hypothetical protein